MDSDRTDWKQDIAKRFSAQMIVQACSREARMQYHLPSEDRRGVDPYIRQHEGGGRPEVYAYRKVQRGEIDQNITRSHFFRAAGKQRRYLKSLSMRLLFRP